MPTYPIANFDSPAGDQLDTDEGETYLDTALHIECRVEVGRSYKTNATDEAGRKADFLAHCRDATIAAAESLGMNAALADAEIVNSKSNGQGGWDPPDPNHFYGYSKYDGKYVGRPDETPGDVVYPQFQIERNP
ncbi:MAG: hypothetical protein AAF726_08335 [Planctomycetota bacterium]